MLVGNPGKIDGHIPPDKIPGMDPDEYDNICESTRDAKRSKPCNLYTIDGKEIHLFNITGKINCWRISNVENIRMILYFLKYCNIADTLYLFSFLNTITDDPLEYHNIAKENPEIVLEMMNRLEEYRLTMIPPNIANDSTKGDPIHFNGTFSPGWCQSEPGDPGFVELLEDVAIEVVT